MKRKIAIVGGGMAGLAAAFDLARTQDLRDRYEVTIYQLGWRLGGKAASSRLADGRIVEHGLHVWFGGYQNSFELLRAAYDARPQTRQAIPSWEEAFEKQSFSVIVGSGDQAKYFGIDWPSADGLPGDGGPPLTLWRCVAQLLWVIKRQTQNLKPELKERLKIPQRIVDLLNEADVKAEGASSFAPQTEFGLFVVFDQSVAISADWSQKLRLNANLRTEPQLRGFVEYLRMVSGHLWDDPGVRGQRGGPFLCELIDVGTALVKGVVLDMALGGASVVDLDAWDFREWLCGFGAHREAVYGSSIVQSLYDTTFQYPDGDKRRPSFGAGSAAQVSLRLFGGYRDTFAYQTVAGLGEVAITPIYRALRRWKVKFAFFHKLTRVELDETRRVVARLHFDRQVDLRRKRYSPTLRPKPDSGDLEYWPDKPLWRQIKGGETLGEVDFESYWERYRTGVCALKRGDDFDDVVLAIPVGAIKPRAGDAGPCEELIAASRPFPQMAATASVTPTLSFQAWCTKTLADMGWPPEGLPHGKKIDFPTCSGPSPLNIWSDRTVVMAHENWPSDQPAPKSLQYLCDVMETLLFQAPPSQQDAPRRANQRARELVIQWLTEKSLALWPAATRDQFDWGLLFCPKSDAGANRRLAFQVIRANIDPWACCAGSPAGSTRWRLRADGSGFAHLYLAGAWIDSGFNVECIESAVLSGRQAARAITGASVEFDGENFLHFQRGEGGLICDLARGAAAAAQVLGLALAGGPSGDYR